MCVCVRVLHSYPLSRYVGLMLCPVTGAKQPNYLVTADDVDTYLAIEVQPLDNRKRKVLFISLSLSFPKIDIHDNIDYCIFFWIRISLNQRKEIIVYTGSEPDKKKIQIEQRSIISD